jgi:small-conductance mechanosensitive channel
LKIAVLISISIVIVNALSFLLINFWLTRKKRTRPSRLLKLIISGFLYLICIFVILRILGQETTTFFTTSALFTAIVGFAMQEPLGNFLSGIFLQINQPFQIGDQIQFQGLEGVVESIDWNSTDIRLNSGEITYIPNGAIAKELVKMIASGSVYRTVDFTTSANIPPNQVMDTACKSVINQPLPNINLDQPVFVRMWSYGLTEVNYKLFYYPKNYSEAENHTDPEIRCRVWYALSRNSMGGEYQSTENERLLQLVSNIEFFRNLTVEAQSLLVENSKTLLFDAEELLDYQNLLSPAIEMNLFLGEPLPLVKITAVEDTEIFAITPVAVANALHHDGISINTMSRYITQYHNNYLTGTLQEAPSRILNQDGISEQIQKHLKPYFRRLLDPLVTGYPDS